MQAEGLVELHSEVVSLRSAVVQMTSLLVDIREELLRNRLASPRPTRGAGSSLPQRDPRELGEEADSEDAGELRRLREELADIRREIAATPTPLRVAETSDDGQVATRSRSAKGLSHDERAELQELRRRLRYLEAELEMREI